MYDHIFTKHAENKAEVEWNFERLHKIASVFLTLGQPKQLMTLKTQLLRFHNHNMFVQPARVSASS